MDASQPPMLDSSIASLDTSYPSTLGTSIASLDDVEDHPPKRRFTLFFSLPAEIRNKIYELLLCHGTPSVIDLDVMNFRRLAPRLEIFLVSKRFHEEAYSVFYRLHTFRLFPVLPRFFGNKQRPLACRLAPHYRAALTSLELRLGPGWNAPPKTWVINEGLGLQDMVNVRTLHVFAECDPSHPAFNGFWKSRDFYTDFSGDLLKGLMDGLENLEVVRFDGFPSVKRDGELMRRLLGLVKERGKRIAWGPERGWAEEVEEEARMSAFIASSHCMDSSNPIPALGSLQIVSSKKVRSISKCKCK